MSLRDEIYNYVSGKENWVSGSELERLALEWTYKGSNASRRARELVQEHKLERRINPLTHCVEYRVKPEKAEQKTLFALRPLYV